MKPILSAIRRWPMGESGFWLAAAALTGALSIAKGLRRPNFWAATGLQLDYSQGFIKRGLLGEALERLGLPAGRLFFVQGFSAIIGLALVAVLGVAVWRGVRRDARFAVAATVFASSAGPAYMAHLIGYPDIVLALIATGLVLVPAGWGRAVLLAAGSAVAILVHEEYLLLFLPITLLPNVLRALRRRDALAATSLALAPAGLVAVLAAGIALALSAMPALSPERMSALLHRQAGRADFPLRTDEFDVLLRSAADNVAVTFHYPFWGDNLAGLLMFAPSAVLFLVWAWRDLAAVPQGWRRAMARAAVLAVVAAPLLMHVIGWDHFRWDAWALFDAFVALFIVQETAPREASAAPTQRLSERARWGVLLLVLLNVGTGGGFMDGRTPRLFPYTDGWTGWPHAPPSADASSDRSDDDSDAAPANETDAATSKPAVQRP